MPPVARAVAAHVLLAVGVLLSGCGGGGKDDPPVTLTSVAVSASVTELQIGESSVLHATAHYSDGTSQDVSATAAWTSSDSDVVSVSAGSSSGATAEAIAEGEATVTATLEGQSGAADLTVLAPTPVSVAITPESLALQVGQMQGLTLTVTFSDGSSEPVTDAVSWSSADAAIASFPDANDGTVEANGAGSTTLTASWNDLSASVTVDVTIEAITAAPYYLGIQQTAVSDGGESGLLVVASNDLTAPPTRVSSLSLQVRALTNRTLANEDGLVTGSEPALMLLAGSGNGGGDFLYQLPMAADSAPTLARLSNESFSTDTPLCMSFSFKEKLKDPASLTLLYSKGAAGSCGSADPIYRVRAGMGESDAPEALPISRAEVGYYNQVIRAADGTATGLIGLGTDGTLRVFDSLAFDHALALEPDVQDFGWLYDGADYALLWAKTSDAYSVYRVTSAGSSAALFSLPLGSGSDGSISSAVQIGDQLYFGTVSHSEDLDTNMVDFWRLPSDGSDVAAHVAGFQQAGFTQSSILRILGETDGVIAAAFDTFDGDESGSQKVLVLDTTVDDATLNSIFSQSVWTSGGVFLEGLSGEHIYVGGMAPDWMSYVLDFQGNVLASYAHTEIIARDSGLSGTVSPIYSVRAPQRTIYLREGLSDPFGAAANTTFASVDLASLEKATVTDGRTGEPFVLADAVKWSYYFNSLGEPAGFYVQIDSSQSDAFAIDPQANSMTRLTSTAASTEIAY